MKIGIVLTLLVTLSLISATTRSHEREIDARHKWSGIPLQPAPGTVKVTPRGSQDGNFCRNDRALYIEYNGIRILIDPGRTIDPDDPLLGQVDVVILSHAHGDHIGDAKPNLAAPGTCASPGTIPVSTPVAATIAATKNAAVLAGGELSDYFARKIADIRGAATASCPGSGPDSNETDVPLTAPCVASLRPGGTRVIKLAGSSPNDPGVAVAMVPAFHSDGIPAGLVDSPGEAPGIAGYGGEGNGVVIGFGNGTRLYYTGDTGLFGDMRTVVKEYYEPNLVVINISDLACLGPREGAYAINEFLTPATVIPEHTNEAATLGGQPIGNRMRLFLQLVDRKTAVEIPLSGITMEFDGRGHRIR